jgi:hypothetical protein
VSGLLGLRARYEYVFLLLPALGLAAGGALAAGLRAAGHAAPQVARAARTGLVALLLLSVLTLGAVGGVTLRALARTDGAAGTRYGASYAAERAAVDWLLARGLALRAYPSFEYVVLADLAYREAPPDVRARYAPVPQVVPYWDQPYLLPVPRGRPLRLASIYEGPPPATPAARFGPVSVVLEGEVGR